jgi:hypothetical protein
MVRRQIEECTLLSQQEHFRIFNSYANERGERALIACACLRADFGVRPQMWRSIDQPRASSAPIAKGGWWRADSALRSGSTALIDL